MRRILSIPAHPRLIPLHGTFRIITGTYP